MLVQDDGQRQLGGAAASCATGNGSRLKVAVLAFDADFGSR